VEGPYPTYLLSFVSTMGVHVTDFIPTSRRHPRCGVCLLGQHGQVSQSNTTIRDFE
jgi:hypothetical protein